MLAAGLFLLAALGANGWRDDFDGANLAARWQFRHPVDGPSVSLTERPGWLRMALPARKSGFNHWLPGPLAPSADAPMLVADPPMGDFDYETRLAPHGYGAHANFHLAMVVGFSPGYVVAWGPFRAPLLGAPKDEPELWCEPTGNGRFFAVAPPARDLFLRIERRGDEYTMLFRRPTEQEWTKAGQYHALAAPRFLGFMGKTFGDASDASFDVDYAAVTEAAPAPEPRATITVAPNPSPLPLDERRYGHFIEHMMKCIYGGLWAEKLFNRKFTGEPHDGVVEGWRGVGADKAAFAHDTATWFAPCQSQRIKLEGNEAGLAQRPMAFRGKVAHGGYVVAMSRPAGLDLRVGLWWGDKLLAEAPLGKTTDRWQALNFSLPAQPANFNAEFRITARGKGTVWLGAVSLMPADNLDGWRRDVVDAVKAVHPPIIRWPGGNFASQYHWRDGIGERDRRLPLWNRAWGGWEWNDVGTDEFMRLCQLLGAAPYLCANAGEGDAVEAADWVEYCNGPARSPMGALRARVHPVPYGVKLWGLGNEMYGDWQHGHLDAAKYGLKAAQMAYAMRQVDSNLETVLVGVEAGGWNNWNVRALAEAAGETNYLSVHYYMGIDVNADPLIEYMRAVGEPAGVETMLDKAWEGARIANGGKPMPLCFDEWNVARPEVDDQPGYKGFYCLREGIFAAEIFNALNRLGPKVPLACVTQTVNVLGLIRVNETTVAPTPSYWMLKLFRDRAGQAGVPVTYKGPAADVPFGRLNLLDSSATYDEKAARLHIFLVNRSASSPVQTEVSVRWESQVAGAEMVTADSYLAANDYQHPDLVKVQPADKFVTATGPHAFAVKVPPFSVVAIDLRTGKLSPE
jgi:alpha-N-arabinofuranosidase